MAKIALTTEKYVIYATLKASGVVERPDIIGAVFGQTEGLLGDDLELRELQKSGRIGRIDVDVETRMGKTTGKLRIPSSLSKEETALVAAAIKTIDRIGPCEASMTIDKVDDVRAAKREDILAEAQKILGGMSESKESSEFSEMVKQNVRTSRIVSVGPDKLPASSGIGDADSIIVVEGRADVVNLLKSGIKDVISMEGTSVPKTISELSRHKNVTAFLDGDRGGDLILKELSQVANVNYVARAPDGKEVEELTQKELLQCLRNRVTFGSMPLRGPASPASRSPRTASQAREYSRPTGRRPASGTSRRSTSSRGSPSGGRSRPGDRGSSYGRPRRDDEGPRSYTRKANLEDAEKYKKVLSKLYGTHAAKLFDKSFKEIGDVPVRELEKVLADLGSNSVETIILDGAVTQGIIDAADKKGVKMVIGNRKHFSKRPVSMKVFSKQEL